MKRGILQDNQADDVTANVVRSRATGALFFVGFGAAWLFAGLKQMHHVSRTNLFVLAAVLAILLGLVLLLLRRASQLPAATTSSQQEVRARRMFNAVNIIQWVSVAIAILIFSLLHLTEYIVPAISFIVGLHLFPLAGVFHYRQHYLTGALLVIWPLGCLLLLPQARVPGVCAVGVSVVLLLSATSTLLRSFVALRSAVPAALAA